MFTNVTCVLTSQMSTTIPLINLSFKTKICTHTNLDCFLPNHFFLNLP